MTSLPTAGGLSGFVENALVTAQAMEATVSHSMLVILCWQRGLSSAQIRRLLKVKLRPRECTVTGASEPVRGSMAVCRHDLTFEGLGYGFTISGATQRRRE